MEDNTAVSPKGMSTGVKVLIGLGGTGLACWVVYYIFSKLKTATVASKPVSNVGQNTHVPSPVPYGAPTPQTPSYVPPPPNPALSNDYVIWTNGIATFLLNNGNTQAAQDIQTQLKNAWSGKGSVPIYDHKSALDVYPTNGIFLQPATTGNVSASQGQSAMLRQVFENAATVLGIVAKNNIQGNTHGQAVGHRQGNVDTLLKQIYGADSNPENIPQLAAALIVVAGYSTDVAAWSQAKYNGGMPPSACLTTVTNAVLCESGALNSIL